MLCVLILSSSTVGQGRILIPEWIGIKGRCIVIDVVVGEYSSEYNRLGKPARLQPYEKC